MWLSEVLNLNTATPHVCYAHEYQFGTLKQLSQASARLQETWWNWARDDHILQALAFSGMFLACSDKHNDENLKWPGTTAVNLLISAIRSVLLHVFLHVKISEHDFGKSDTNQSADSWRQVGFMRGLNAWTMSITRLGFEMQRTYGICMNVQNSWNRRTMTNYTKQIRIRFFSLFPHTFFMGFFFGCVVSDVLGRAHVVLATCLLPSTPSPIGTASMRPRQIWHVHKWRSFEGFLYAYILCIYYKQVYMYIFIVKIR